MIRKTLFAAALAFAFALPLVRAQAPAQLGAMPATPKDARGMSYLDNGKIRIGVDLNLGGAITYLAQSDAHPNLINSYDWGRQIQMSHYAGPIPYEFHDKKPMPMWATLGWNPIQSGDVYGHRARVLAHTNDGKEMYTRCIPMQWPLQNVPGDCTFETWISLDGNTVNVRCRLRNYRADTVQYQGWFQELPAIYTNAPWHKLLTYRGDKPWTNGALSTIPPQFPWANWQATENWAALVNDKNFGVGVWHDNVFAFVGGFYGTPGAGGERDVNSGYMGPSRNEILDHNIVYDYCYALIVGDIHQIRRRVYQLSSRTIEPPNYRFTRDRRHWIYTNATDTGWPIRGELKILLDKGDPNLLGPDGFWQAAEAPKLYIEAALQSDQSRGEVFWKRFDAPQFSDERKLGFDLVPDGKMRVYEIDLSRAPEYQGAITGLRFDPISVGKSGDFIRIKSIGFRKPAR